MESGRRIFDQREVLRSVGPKNEFLGDQARIMPSNLQFILGTKFFQGPADPFRALRMPGLGIAKTTLVSNDVHGHDTWVFGPGCKC